MGFALHPGGHGHSHGGGGPSDSEGTSSSSTSEYSDSCTGDEESPQMENGNGHHGSYGSITDQMLPGQRSSKSKKGGHHSNKANINVRAAFVHVVGDLLQSIGVLIAALIIYFKPEWKLADPICTFVFSLIVLVTTMTIMRDILVVLMEGTPRNVDFAAILRGMKAVSGVQDVHDLRIWSLSMHKVALSVHVAITKGSNPLEVMTNVSRMIQEKYGITETTVQVEEYVEKMQDCTHCKDLE